MWKLGLLVTLCAVLQITAYAANPMVTINGHTMVKLHTFCRQFGAVAAHDTTTNTFSVSRNAHTVYLIPYSTTAWIDDTQVNMEHPAVTIDQHLYVPLRFMCRALGLDCTWGPSFQTVVIVDNFTHTQVTWGRSTGWDARSHIWSHPATFRISLSVTAPPRKSFHGHALSTAGIHTSSMGGNQPIHTHSQPAGHTVPVVHGQPSTPHHSTMGVSHGQPSTLLHPTMGINHAQPSTPHHSTMGVSHGQPPTTHKPTTISAPPPSHAKSDAAAGSHGHASGGTSHASTSASKSDNKDNKHHDR